MKVDLVPLIHLKFPVRPCPAASGQCPSVLLLAASVQLTSGQQLLLVTRGTDQSRNGRWAWPLGPTKPNFKLGF